jgi:hypothetical protein
MRGKYLGLGAIFFILLLAGCTENQPPLSGIPTILIDYIEETEETKVFVKGIDDRLFSNITIQINDTSITENYTYQLHISTSLDYFNLYVSVWDKQKEYEYSGNVTLYDDNGEIRMEIKEVGEDKYDKESFPHKIIMERK